MNARLPLALLAATLCTALSGPAVADACQPQVVADDTAFPTRSQLRGQRGTVVMDITVDEQGRAQSAEIVESSGYRLLDRAAEQSALARWQFDVSTCDRNDLPVRQRIAVEYRNDEY